MQSKICYGITLNNYALQQEKKGEKPQVHEITNQLHREDLLHREGCIRKRNEMLQSNNFFKNGPENWHKDMVIMGLTMYSRFLLFPELRAALSHQLGTVPVPVFPFSQDRSQILDPRSQIPDPSPSQLGYMHSPANTGGIFLGFPLFHSYDHPSLWLLILPHWSSGNDDIWFPSSSQYTE